METIAANEEKMLTVANLWMQVIFSALDIRVKNVAQTYSLEHKGESTLFDHLFELLNSATEIDETYRRELASSTGALQTSVSQHLAKEQKQVLYFFTAGAYTKPTFRITYWPLLNCLFFFFFLCLPTGVPLTY